MMRRILQACFAFALCAAAVQAASTSADAAVPASHQLHFTVFRNGSEIGQHQLTFKNDGADMRVDIDTHVAVKVAFVTAYRFEHEGHEIWHGGRLVRLWSKTNDDGTKHILDAEAADNRLEIHGDGKQAEAAATIVPASLWNEAIVRGGSILNTLDGSRMAVQVTDLGAEKIAARGHQISAHHYAITGDLQREVWYDADNVLVRVRFKGKDGSDIDYVLQ